MTNSFSVYDATSEDSSELRELISSYSELAARDSFTGLYSKGHANNLLQEMFAVQKEQLKLTLALIDIDHFKSVNDRFGHLCGDEVILYVVDKINALNEQCSGWAARIGGDEFYWPALSVIKTMWKGFAWKCRKRLQVTVLKRGTVSTV